jgi:hypothetical protein
MGGQNRNWHLRNAEVYYTSMGQWRALPDMSVSRRDCAAVCVDGNVYVVGGEDDATKQASVECYDPVANGWCTLPSMGTARACRAAQDIDRNVYVVGGSGNGGEHSLRSAQVFYASMGQWRALPDVSVARWGLRGSVCRREFVRGGWKRRLNDKRRVLRPGLQRVAHASVHDSELRCARRLRRRRGRRFGLVIY